MSPELKHIYLAGPPRLYRVPRVTNRAVRQLARDIVEGPGDQQARIGWLREYMPRLPRDRRYRRALTRAWQRRIARDGDPGYASAGQPPVIIRGGYARIPAPAPLPFRHRRRHR